MKHTHKQAMAFFLSCLLFFQSGCAQKDVEQEQQITIVIGVLAEDSKRDKWIDRLNRANEDFQIEIREYEELTDLQIEITAGKGPDIIDFQTGFVSEFSTSSVAGGITENLYPLMNNDNSFVKETYLENIWDSFAIGDSLYVMPTQFCIRTFSALQEITGDIQSWNYAEMKSIYQKMDDDVILYPGETKGDVFSMIWGNTMDHYVDWDTGECKFNSAEFVSLLEFSNLFPETLIMADDYSALDTLMNGKALIFPTSLLNVYEIAVVKGVFGGKPVNFIGYPMENGISGHIIQGEGSMLGISANSKHKELAWEILKTFYTEEFQENVSYFPMRRDTLESRLNQAMQPIYEMDSQGQQVQKAASYIMFEGEDSIPIYVITKEDKEDLLNIIESAEINNAIDWQLRNILSEEIGAYFSGDKTVEEVADIIQKRASIYAAERIK